MSRNQAERAADQRLQRFVAAHARRVCAKPLGARQLRILTCARQHLAAGRPFPSALRLHAALNYSGPVGDIHQSLCGLVLRGLIERHGDGWRLTAIGKVLPVVTHSRQTNHQQRGTSCAPIGDTPTAGR